MAAAGLQCQIWAHHWSAYGEIWWPSLLATRLHRRLTHIALRWLEMKIPTSPKKEREGERGSHVLENGRKGKRKEKNNF